MVLGAGVACKAPKTLEEIQRETQAAFNEGMQAFKDGKARDTNPYVNAKDAKENPHKAKGWFDGWDKAKADKEEADRKAAEEKAAAERRAAEEEAARRRAEAEKAEAARRAEAERAAALRTAAEAALKDINFAYDKSAIRDTDKPKLQAIGDFLKAFPQAKLRLEGHCDERGTIEYNLALGERRASATKSYLVSLGVAEDRLSTISYGKERPKVEGRNEATWLINRRCEFKLL
ncbi:MAG: OmpA family protein [Firmicutes bacterium]|nr:OmpA family protein [Bacillota bacterium]